jgi:hypothetical protein
MPLTVCQRSLHGAQLDIAPHLRASKWTSVMMPRTTTKEFRSLRFLLRMSFRSGSPTSCSMPSLAKMGVDLELSPGGILHVHFEKDSRAHGIDVWDSAEPHEPFVQSTLVPAMGKGRFSKRPRSVQHGRTRNNDHRGPPLRSLSDEPGSTTEPRRVSGIRDTPVRLGEAGMTSALLIRWRPVTG